MRPFELPDLLGRHRGHAVAPQVRRRADGEEQAPAVPRHRQVLGPVPLHREVADDHFGRPARFAGAAAIRVADHLVRRRHVDVPRIGGRQEGDAVGPVEVPGKDVGRRWRAARLARGEDEHAPGTALRNEDVAVRRHAHSARLVEPAGEHAYLEAVRHARRRAPRGLHHLRGVGDRRFGVGARHRRRGQIGRPDVVANPGCVASPVAEDARPGTRLRARGMAAGERSQQDRQKQETKRGPSRSAHAVLPRLMFAVAVHGSADPPRGGYPLRGSAVYTRSMKPPNSAM